MMMKDTLFWECFSPQVILFIIIIIIFINYRRDKHI